jgi:hypothetical protein
MEEILLFGNLEGQTVVNIHNSNHEVNHMKAALQHKFNQLRNMKIPTGDLHCPANVCLAKKGWKTDGPKV